MTNVTHAELAADDGSSLVGHILDATGADARTVQAKLRELSVSPEDFGAVGDGMVDDSAAVSAAIAAAGAVRLTPGKTYLLETGGLTVPDDKSLIGDGTARLTLGGNFRAVTITGSNVLVRGFKISGQASTYKGSANDGIYVDWTSAAGSNVRIEDIWVDDIGGAGIAAQASSGTASSGLVVRNCRITNVGTHGILTQDYISNVLIAGNYVSATSLNYQDRPGITASRAGANVIVSDNICIGGPWTGFIEFDAQPAADSTITINGVVFTFKASGATGNQINIGADLAATMANAVAVLNASADASVDDATYSTDGSRLIARHDTPGPAGASFTLAAEEESNGTAVGSGSIHGISIDVTDYATAKGNVCRGWTGYGIEVGFCNGATFETNSIEGCGVGIGLSGIETAGYRNENCVVAGNTILNCLAVGIYGFMSGATGAFLHQDITITGNVVANIGDGATIGTGYQLQHIDGLVLDVMGVKGCFHSGVLLLDCPNHHLSARGVRANNLVGGLKTIDELTNASGITATATCINHGYSTSDVVTVIGASPTEYNQAGAPITRIDDDTFTYLLPRSGLANAAGGIKVGKARSGAHAGIRVLWVQIAEAADRGRCRGGIIEAWGNGYRDFYDINENGFTGLINGILYLPDVPGGPGYVANLTSGLSANVMDRMAIYGQNGKIAISYNDGGTQKYAVLDLGAGTGTWADGTTPP